MRDEAMTFITWAYNMLMSDFSKKMIENQYYENHKQYFYSINKISKHF